MGLKLALYGYDTDLGKLILESMEELSLKPDELFPLGALAGEYDAVTAGGRHFMVTPVDEFDFSRADLAVLCCTQDETHRLCARIREAGCTVIDASHLYSGTRSTPVVQPAVNPEVLNGLGSGALVIPAMSLTTQIALTLRPLMKWPGISGVTATCMVSASEHGRPGTETLARETAQLLNGVEPEHQDFDDQLAFNLHSAIGSVSAGEDTLLEKTVRDECVKLLGNFAGSMDVTCLQVPVFYGHTVSMRIELAKPAALERLRALLDADEYLRLAPDDRAVSCVTDAVGSRQIIVHRLRRGGRANIVNLVTMMDNWRLGEAVSCVQIARLLHDKMHSAAG